MNLPKLLFYVLTLGLGIGSCQSKVQEPMPVGGEKDARKLVASITYGIDPDAEKWYEYNEDGEIIRYNSFIDTVTFVYTKDSITKTYGNASNQWQTSVTYYLDGNGRADSSAIRGENNELISAYKFSCDDQGFLIETMQDVFTSGNTYKQTMKYNQGNLAEIVTFTFDGRPYAKYVYDYFMDKVNPLNINLHHVLEDFLSRDRLGKDNKNLIRSMANVSMEGDTLALLTFTYPEPKNTDSFIQVEIDVLNENTTERTYHFKK